MAEDVIVKLLGNVGVPTAICFYTLFQVNKSLEKLTDAFNRWSDLIDRRLKDIELDMAALKNSQKG